MLDQSVGKIYELQINNPTVEIQQFRTPLTQYKSGNIPYILDNGAYSGFDEKKFLRMANASKNDIFCKYIVMPDVVGDAQSTYNQFRYYKNIIGLRPNQTAFVLQDGAETGYYRTGTNNGVTSYTPNVGEPLTSYGIVSNIENGPQSGGK